MYTQSLDLNKPELKELMRLTIDDWFNVGLQLNLKWKDLDNIYRSYSEPNIRRRIMFKLWLDSSGDPSYRSLATALKHANEYEAATDVCPCTQYGKYPVYSIMAYSRTEITSSFCS